MSEPSGATFSEELARFVSSLSFGDLSDDAVDLADRAFVDSLGVALGGATQPAGQRAANYVDDLAAPGPASVIGTDVSASVPDAALANAIAGHCLDYDDTVIEMACHPSVPITMPILALADARGATGEQLVTAYTAGFEVMNYVNLPIMPAHYQHGWHSTGTIGTFGAAAASCKLLGLDPDQTANVLNIAASMPAGVQRNFGTMTKAIHAGQAARSGVTAALMADTDYRAHHDAIAGDNGFFEVYGGDDEPTIHDRPGDADDLALERYGIWIKKYPSCGANHQVIGAAAMLRDTEEYSPRDIEDVHLTVSQQAADIHPYPDPETPDEAKYSLEYTAARTLVHGEPGIRDFEPDEIGDPETQYVRDRVSYEADPDIDYNSLTARVSVELSDGRTLEYTLDYPPGHPENPLTVAEFRGKFIDSATYLLDEDRADEVYEYVSDLHEQDDVGDVIASI